MLFSASGGIINGKVSAEQDAQRKVIELQQFQADANKKVVEAEGDAKAQIARANGSAEANRILNASVTENILKMRALDNEHDAIWRWNQQMPTTLILGGDNNKKLLFDVPVGK